MNSRYYDSKIARFLSEDTYSGNANDPLSLNTYTYCYNNPLIYWDPTGHIVTQWDIDHGVADAVQAATDKWEDAKARGDTAGMTAAHDEAEAARQPHRQSNEHGTANGYTVDDNGNVLGGHKDSNNVNSNGNNQVPGNSQESVVISGNNDGGHAMRNFIEPAIKQINDWRDVGKSNITWIIVDSGYTYNDKNQLQSTADKRGVKIIFIQNKNELFDYFNTGTQYIDNSSEFVDGERTGYQVTDRNNVKISDITIFSHGLAPRHGESNVGTLALDYHDKGENGDYTNDFNISIKDLQDTYINRNSFTKDVSTTFYSCNTGTSNTVYNTSFAQIWADKTGGTVKALSGGLYSYAHINDGRSKFWWQMDSIYRNILGKGYSGDGCLNYPVPGSPNDPTKKDSAHTYLFEKGKAPILIN